MNAGKFMDEGSAYFNYRNKVSSTLDANFPSYVSLLYFTYTTLLTLG